MPKKQKSVVKTQITDVTKTIEEVNNKPKVSKKRKILMVIFFALSIAIVVLTIKFILDINWTNLFNSIANGFDQRMGILWFFLLFLYFIFVNMNNYVILWVKLKRLGYKIPQIEYWLLGFTTSFFRCVTPTFMGDSFALVWMKSNGVPTYRVTSLLFTNTFLWQCVQYLVTFPAFVLVLINRQYVLHSADGIAVFTLLCVGIVIDTFSVAFMYLLCVSKKMHYFLSKVFNWIKKKLHLKYHTKAEIAEKYEQRAVMKQEFYNYMKDWKSTIFVILWLVLAEVLTYVAIGWSMYFVQYIHVPKVGIIEGKIYKVDFDFIWACHCANVTFTANRLNFLVPNGEGSLEYILRTYLTHFCSFSATPKVTMSTELGHGLIKSITDNSILVWRFFGAFLPAFFGIVTLVWWSIRQSQRVKVNKRMFAEEK